MIFSLLGVLWAWRDQAAVRSVFVLAIITSATLILVPMAAGQARFRVPAEPFLALIAGYGLVALAACWRRRSFSLPKDGPLPGAGPELVEAPDA
jgi:hypothetical protein